MRLVSVLLLSLSLLSVQAETDISAAEDFTDRIYDVSNDRFIEQDDLIRAMKDSTYILLGEIHDNSRHHKIQDWAIKTLATQSGSASVSFEMIDQAQAEQIGDINALDADSLVEQLSQFDASWNYQKHYKALFASAFDAGLPIYPANIDRKKIMGLMQGEPVPLSDETEQLYEDTVFSEQMINSLKQQIVDSHCGMFDAAAAAPMVKAQRLRDVAMALSLLNSSTDKRILIAGAGHVRNDRGVPVYLKSRESEAKIISLGMYEYDADPIQSSDWRGSQLPFDYVWFTESVDREDPCLAFKEMKEQT